MLAKKKHWRNAEGAGRFDLRIPIPGTYLVRGVSRNSSSIPFMKSTWSVFALILWMVPCLGQSPAYFILGKEEFANTDIYTLYYQDEKDLLYVGTNHGLFVYKQNRFLQLEASPGQIGNSVYSLQENENGGVFCCNLTGQILKVVGNGLEIHYESPTDWVKRGFEFYLQGNGNMTMISLDRLWTVDSDMDSKVLMTADSLQGLLAHSIERKSHLFSMGSKLPNGDIVIGLPGLPHVMRLRGQSLELLREDGLRLNSTYVVFSALGGKIFSIEHSGPPQFNPDGIELEFMEEDPIRFMQVNDREILGLDLKSGGKIFQLAEGDKVVKKEPIFRDIFLSTFAKNGRGTFFLGTFGGGVIVVPNRNVIKLASDDLLLSIASSPTNEVYISSREGNVYSAHGGLRRISGTSFNIDNVFYLSGNFDFGYRLPPSLLFNCEQGDFPPIKAVQEMDSNGVLIAHSLGLSAFVKGDSHPQAHGRHLRGNGIENFIFKGERCISTTWDAQDSLFYFSSNFRVYSRPWSDLETDTLYFNGEEFRAASMTIGKGKLICASEESGVLFFEHGVCVDQIGEQHGLKSNTVEKVLLKDSLLFVLTRGGLQVQDLNSGKFLGLGIPEGVVYGQVTDFSLSDDMLWILEKHSCYGIALEDLGSNVPVGKLYLDSIRINRKRIGEGEKMRFPFDENALEVFFDYRDVETDQNTQIQYRLKGFDEDWRQLNYLESRIVYEYLPPGNFEFEMRGIFREQSTNTISFPLTIRPPFWQQWWFFLMVFLGIALGLSIGFTIRIRNIRRKSKAKLEKQALLTNALDSKLKALRSQMNPHFIFNSLNSIQALILKERTDESYDYVVMFSNLVRKILSYSEKDFINLEDELEFLELYLSLESLRLKEDFEFSITYQGKQEIKVPSLMVQPFLENAIHHGLLHKSGPKRLDIHFKFDENLQCVITDNGIGRKMVQEIQNRQNSKHVSFSLLATQKRMELLGEQYGHEAGLEIIDLYEDGLAVGTKVLLKLPYILRY